MTTAFAQIPAGPGVCSHIPPHHDAARSLARFAGAVAAGWADLPEQAVMAPGFACRRISMARHLAFYLAHVTYGLSQHAAARAFARHRATIAYACRKIEAARDDAAFDVLVDLLEAEALRAAHSLVRP